MNVAVGIDVGGSAIKGAAVDAAMGELLTHRRHVRTPQGGSIEDITREVGHMVAKVREDLEVTHLDAHTAPIGVALPGVVRSGRLLTAANIDTRWIGTDAAALFQQATGHHCIVLNDADAAGLAEARFGAARHASGVTLMLTFGTGIGSALISDGHLVPNLELGHLQLDGHRDIEQHAAARVLERDGVTLNEWADRAARYIRHLEILFHPDRFVLGGGISESWKHYLPFTGVTAPVIPAQFTNNAGVVGAAWLAQFESV